MKTNGFDRALRYFVQQTEIYVAGTVGGSILLSIYMCMINSYVSFSDMLNTFPATIFYVSAVVILSITTNAGQHWFPMLLSFGCRRKYVFWGQFVMLMLFIIQTLALYQLSGIWLDVMPFPFLTALMIDLAVAGITMFLNLAMLRWGKIAYIAMVVMIVAISLFYGLWAGFFGSDASNPSVLLFDQWPVSWQLILSAAAIALYTAANIMNYRTLSTYEVKA